MRRYAGVQLGYFEPGHVETLCYAEGRDHPLARTALYHEIAHENLTSWSSIGQFAQALNHIAPHVTLGASPDPFVCLGLLADASRQTHEGFATYSQLMYIYQRFGQPGFDDALSHLPEDYRMAATRFFLISKHLTSGNEKFDFGAVALAVRSFAIAALNVDIFQSHQAICNETKVEVVRYLSDVSRSPDERLAHFASVFTGGDAEELRQILISMLTEVTTELEALEGDPAAMELKHAEFSRSINPLVMKALQRHGHVDLTILNQAEFRPKVENFLASAAQHYQIDPVLLMPRWSDVTDPLRKQDQKAHHVEFSDAQMKYKDIEQITHRDLCAFLDRAIAQHRPAVVALMPTDLNETAWVLDAAVRDDNDNFRAGVSVARAAQRSLRHVIDDFNEHRIAVVVFDGLLDALSTEARTVILQHCNRAYVFCTVVSLAQIQALSAQLLGDRCAALMLHDAIGHNALLVVKDDSARRHLVAILAEDVVPRYEFFLRREFDFEARTCKRDLDGEVLLAAWHYTYGPCSDFIRASRS